MAPLSFLYDFSAKFHASDWLALIFFMAGLLGYRYFLAFMLRRRPENLYLGKLQQYRKAWIEANRGSENNIVVVQSLRNTIMSASFLASTAVILIMGAFNLLLTLETADQGRQTSYMAGTVAPEVLSFKILLVILILAYSFFNFTWYIREVNYMSFILNVPKDKLDEIEGEDSTKHLAKMFLTSGLYFSLGMRGYYFMVPLLLWFFSPLLMVLSYGIILFILLRRDLAG